MKRNKKIIENCYCVILLILICGLIPILLTSNTNFSGPLSQENGDSIPLINNDSKINRQKEKIFNKSIPQETISTSIKNQIASVDKNNNLIVDDFEQNLIKNQTRIFLPLFVFEKPTKNNTLNASRWRLNTRKTFINHNLTTIEEIPSSKTFIFSCEGKGNDILECSERFNELQTAEDGALLLYIKENGDIRQNMLSSFNQLRLNSKEFSEMGLRGDPDTRLAILDRGIDDSHNAFIGKDIIWEDFTNMEYPTPVDYVGHGTALGSIAAGNEFQPIDGEGRTIISMAQTLDWGINSYGWEVGKEYLFFMGSAEVGETGTLKFQANWSKEGYSKINIQKIVIIDENGNYRVNSSGGFSQNQLKEIQYEINNENKFGIYRFGYTFMVEEDDPFSTQHLIHGQAHVPMALINQSTSEKTKTFRGVAPNVDLALLRVEFESDIIQAMNWLLDNAKSHNITVVCISLSTESLEVHNLANEMAESGLVIVCAAGNDGPGINHFKDYANSPATAEKVITVGAVGRNNSLTSYTNQGGKNPVGVVIKPDILAPGGEFTSIEDLNTPLLLADANPNEFLQEIAPEEEEDPVQIISLPEKTENDIKPFYGTSFGAPWVAGVALLMIEKMGGMNSWTYSEKDVLKIKNLLCMSASETAPANRIGYQEEYSPLLNRGEKDIYEGYGRINPVEALNLLESFAFTNITISNKTLYSIETSNQNIEHNYNYSNTLAIPYKIKSNHYIKMAVNSSINHDLDIYVYDRNPNAYGEPQLLFNATYNNTDGKKVLERPFFEGIKNVYVVIKSIKGFGKTNISLTQEIDLDPPISAHIFSPKNYSYQAKNLKFKIQGYDKGTRIHSVDFYALKTNQQGEDLSQNSQYLGNSPYNETVDLDITNIETGWYNITLEFLDGNNNGLNSSPIICGIDNNGPIITKMKPESRTYQRGYITFTLEANDSFSGIRSMMLHMYDQPPIILKNESYQITNYSIGDEWQIPKANDCIKITYTLKTDRSWDGDRVFYFTLQDLAGNKVNSKDMILFIQNVRFHTIEFSAFVSISIITLLLLNSLAKRILVKIDWEKTLEIIQNLPEIVKRHIYTNLIHPSKS